MDSFFRDARDFLPFLLKGVKLTIALTICALLCSLVLGFIWNLMESSSIAPLRWISRFLITITRGIPIIVQLFYVYFVLPDMGIQLNGFSAGVVGLSFAYSVYQAEIFRSGFNSIDRSLIETADSLGMRPSVILRRIKLPLAFRVMLPPLGNTSIMLLKDSSIASTITVVELTGRGQMLAVSTFRNSVVYTLVAVLYLAMSLPLTFVGRYFERRLKR